MVLWHHLSKSQMLTLVSGRHSTSRKSHHWHIQTWTQAVSTKLVITTVILTAEHWQTHKHPSIEDGWNQSWFTPTMDYYTVIKQERGVYPFDELWVSQKSKVLASVPDVGRKMDSGHLTILRALLVWQGGRSGNRIAGSLLVWLKILWRLSYLKKMNRIHTEISYFFKAHKCRSLSFETITFEV